VTRTATQAKRTTEGVARGGKRFGEAVWRPFVRLSGVLWLEFTGVFFGIFAMYAASGAWKLRGELRETAANHDAHVHFLIAAVMAIVFTYFCVSSFLRAQRKGRAR
jgi:undecaprenyl pyrophosphate phosphatase UppP